MYFIDPLKFKEIAMVINPTIVKIEQLKSKLAELSQQINPCPELVKREHEFLIHLGGPELPIVYKFLPEEAVTEVWVVAHIQRQVLELVDNSGHVFFYPTDRPACTCTLTSPISKESGDQFYIVTATALSLEHCMAGLRSLIREHAIKTPLQTSTKAMTS